MTYITVILSTSYLISKGHIDSDYLIAAYIFGGMAFIIEVVFWTHILVGL